MGGVDSGTWHNVGDGLGARNVRKLRKLLGAPWRFLAKLMT